MRIDAPDNIFLKPQTQSVELKPKSDSSFAHWVTDKISNTNEQLNTADQELNQLASGKTENLHQTMLTLEQAKLSFQFLEQIRNRILNAYQDLLREQI